MYGPWILIIGIFIGLEGPVWFSSALKYFQNRKILKEVTPTDIKPEKLCEGPHHWISARAYTDKGISLVQVCQLCGFIPSSNKMASPEAIDRIEENNKIGEVEDRIYADFLAKEDGDIKKYFDQEIKNGVNFEKLIHIHSAGMTFGTRYYAYKSTRAEEVKKVLNRNNS